MNIGVKNIRSIGLALLVSFAVILTGGIVLALFYLNGVISESAVVITGLIVLLIAGLVGAVISAKGGESGIAIQIAIYDFLFTLLLMAVGTLILEGVLSHIIRTVVTLVVSGLISCAICLRKGKESKRRK